MKQLYLKLLVALLLSAPLFEVLASAPDAYPPSCAKKNGKYLYWTGEENNDFFNENNWREGSEGKWVKKEKKEKELGKNGKEKKAKKDKGYCLSPNGKAGYQICVTEPDLKKDKHPKAGEINPGVPIAYNLYIDDAVLNITGDVVFDCAQNGLTVEGSTIRLNNRLTNGVLTVDYETDVYFTAATALGAEAVVNMLDAESWIRFEATTPDIIEAQHLAAIWVSDVVGNYKQNFRVNQYYQTGAIVRKIDSAFKPLEIFSETNLSGNTAAMSESVIYAGETIPNGMDNAAKSFRLKRGYMATLAVEENGTSKSKVFIASEEDLIVPELTAALLGNVSFIRVLPWNWVTKKGTGGYIDGLDAGWFYSWSATKNSESDNEYAPMTWGAGATSDASLDAIIAKYQVNHLLGFNESDNCDDQSGKFNNLCEPAVAVAYYENIMRTGMRLGTPAPRENGPTGWLKEFNQIAKEKDVRFDFVAVHWYDWGSSPQNSPYADAQQVFNRFKNYLTQVHNLYQLPIWITEFNANPNRDNSVQAAFLALALPYLEQLEYVERYAYFQPDSRYGSTTVNSANYFDGSGNLTNIGTIYLNHKSTPSIPEATFIGSNNLNGMDVPWIEEAAQVTSFEAECALSPGSQWDVKADAQASNQLYVQGDPNKAGASDIAKQIHFDFDLGQPQDSRLWIKFRSAGNTSVKIRMDDGDFTTVAGINSAQFGWFKIPRFYELAEGKHRLTIEFMNSNFELDQLAFSTTSAAVNIAPAAAASCAPANQPWGLVKTDLTYFMEAENATSIGDKWSTATAPKAVNGQFLQLADDVSATTTVPGAPNQVMFEVTISETDHYDIWGKIQSKGNVGDTYWIKVDNEPFRRWSNLNNDIYDWYWKKFHYSEGGEDRNFAYFLTAGTHQVTFASSRPLAKLDRLAITSLGRNPADEDANVVKSIFISDYEAENAELLGTASVVSCATSSNGQQVNMGKTFANGVRFNEVLTDESGTYKLSVQYMSKVTRYFRVIVNGNVVGLRTATSSGNWCFEGGNTAIHEINVQLNAGVNTIELRTQGYGALPDAPFMDKINIAKISSAARIKAVSSSSAETEVQLLTAYPNPAAVNATITVKIPASERVSWLNILDMTGRVRFSEKQEASTGKVVTINPALPSGMYFIRVHDELQHQTSKLIIR